MSAVEPPTGGGEPPFGGEEPPTKRARHSYSRQNRRVLKEIAKCLEPEYVPTELPGRENELEKITEFIEKKLSEKRGGVMEIRGVPGTGKTAVLEVIKKKFDWEKDDQSRFKCVEVNPDRMPLDDPFKVFRQVLWQITGQTRHKMIAKRMLNKQFTDPALEKEPMVMFIDQLDYLTREILEILTEIYTWATQPDSQLVVLAIGNCMFEKVNCQPSERLEFKPYTEDELFNIMQSRLVKWDEVEGKTEGIPADVFERMYIELFGNARRVIKKFLSVFERFIRKKEDMVNFDYVREKMAKMGNWNRVIGRCIRDYGENEEALLKTLVHLYYRTDKPPQYMRFLDVFDAHRERCIAANFAVPSMTSFHAMIREFCSEGLFRLDPIRGGWSDSIRIGYSDFFSPPRIEIMLYLRSVIQDPLF